MCVEDEFKIIWKDKLGGKVVLPPFVGFSQSSHSSWKFGAQKVKNPNPNLDKLLSWSRVKVLGRHVVKSKLNRDAPWLWLARWRLARLGLGVRPNIVDISARENLVRREYRSHSARGKGRGRRMARGNIAGKVMISHWPHQARKFRLIAAETWGWQWFIGYPVFEHRFQTKYCFRNVGHEARGRRRGLEGRVYGEMLGRGVYGHLIR